MSPSIVRSRTLTIYLVKEGASNPAGIVNDVAALTDHPVGIADEFEGVLYIRPSFANRPHWTTLFDGHVDLSRLRNMSTSAVLLLPIDNRLFALTFGYGKHLLLPGSYEEGFGLRVTLGAIQPDSIKSLDKRTFDAISQHSRQQASRGATTREFGLNIEQDLLQAVTGTPDDEALGSRMSGKDALVVTAKIELASIPTLLASYFELYTSRKYREEYPWIDQVDEVRDRPLRTTLDGLLVSSLRAGDFERLWLAVPEIINWTDVSGFKYSASGRSDLFDDLHIQDFLDALRDPSNVSVSTLHQRHVHVMSASTDQVRETWQVYRCIYFETEYAGSKYLLNDARWYRVDPDFIAEVDQRFARVEHSDVELPAYEDDSETSYNRRVAEAERDFALMDEKFVYHGGGRSKEEFCDLYSSNRQLIHVKRYGQSRVLSHLFAQGLISAELFYMDPTFRRKLNELLPTSHKLADPAARPRPVDYDVVFAIVSNAPGDLELPFFSKLNLVNTARRIEAFGYQVHVKKIGVQDTE